MRLGLRNKEFTYHGLILLLYMILKMRLKAISIMYISDKESLLAIMVSTVKNSGRYLVMGAYN